MLEFLGHLPNHEPTNSANHRRVACPTVHSQPDPEQPKSNSFNPWPALDPTPALPRPETPPSLSASRPSSASPPKNSGTTWTRRNISTSFSASSSRELIRKLGAQHVSQPVRRRPHTSRSPRRNVLSLNHQPSNYGNRSSNNPQL